MDKKVQTRINEKALPRIVVLLVILGSLTVAMGIKYGVDNHAKAVRAGENSERALTKIMALRRSSEIERTREHRDGISTEIGSGESSVELRQEFPVVFIDGTGYIGTLEIEEIDLILPVISTWEGDNLSKAPCRYFGCYPDDFVIAAHNYRSQFGGLSSLSLGDSIIFEDMNGNVFQYTVEALEIVGAYDSEKIIEGNPALTLFTCTDGGKMRFAVRCSLVS